MSVSGGLYRLPNEVWWCVEAGDPSGLYRGPVELADVRVVDGMLSSPELAEGLRADISAFGDWRVLCCLGRVAGASLIALPKSGALLPAWWEGKVRPGLHPGPSLT